MKHDSAEIIIKKELNTIQTPEYDIVSGVKKEIIRKQKVTGRRPLYIAGVICMCLMVSIGVMGATIPSFNKLLSVVGSDIALLLQPVEISSEDQGIKMEVVAAMNDDEMSVVYFTMQDLVGDRIDKTLDIYDYSMEGASLFNCQLVDYDETSKTAILRMQANGGEELKGKKVNFQVASFLSDKMTFAEAEAGVDLSDIKECKDSQTMLLDMDNCISGGSGLLFKELREQRLIKVLKNDQMQLTLPKIDFMYISNMGIIDGRLHIQIKWIGDGIDDHGYLYFTDAYGNKVDINPSTISFGSDESGNLQYGRNYCEYIYDIEDLKLANLKLKGYFVTHGNYVTGNWKTTFKLASVGEELQSNCYIETDTLSINNIKVSPLGITLVGSKEDKDILEINDLQEIMVGVKMNDGSVQIFKSATSFNNNGKVILKYLAASPLDVNKVESASINGTVIDSF